MTHRFQLALILQLFTANDRTHCQKERIGEFCVVAGCSLTAATVTPGMLAKVQHEFDYHMAELECPFIENQT